MKILTIPDLHGRKFWRESISNNAENVDKVIFLGDYLDPYPNEIKKYPETMECSDFYDSESLLKILEDIISLKKDNPTKYILLTGNHSDSYIWSNFEAATRTDKYNWSKYHNFFKDNLKHFNLAYIQDDVIFTHAGITKNWSEKFLYDYMEYDEGAELENDSSIFETAIVLKDTPLEDFNRYYIDAISEISYLRGGPNMNGSCEWADILEHIDLHQTEAQEKIVPIGENRLYQVFGHTQLEKPLINDKWACLDCRKSFIIDTVTHEITES
jgi:hypothetical protein